MGNLDNREWGIGNWEKSKKVTLLTTWDRHSRQAWERGIGGTVKRLECSNVKKVCLSAILSVFKRNKKSSDTDPLDPKRKRDILIWALRYIEWVNLLD
jgi:hypothetical protein